MMPRRHSTRVLAVLALAPALGLASCGGIDGVQFEGKIFDVLGVSGSEQRREPKLADRAPLVVPPNTTKLPEPGSGKTSSEDLAALNDPELKKVAAAKDRERLHLAYCRGDIQWKDSAYDPGKTGANRSPYGACPSLISGSGLDKK